MKPIYKKTIYTLAIVLPLAVAALTRIHIEGYDFRFLPKIYATLNEATSIFLIFALLAIRYKKVQLHERIIELCLFFSALFLIFYVIYHATSTPVHYAGEFALLYYSVLISHIVLSALVVPLVLFAFVYGKERAIAQHKKMVRFAFPLWWYVATSGVVIYYMISPFY